jgi:enoyl-CoA hydratase/carnithine racemase
MRNDLVHVARDGPIARLTLSDPERANVLSEAMMIQLCSVLDETAADDGARAVVLAAEGKIFCAGHDLAELRAADGARAEVLFRRCSDLMLKISGLRVPVIARVQGAAVAAGCQLVATCDLAYAAETAKFAVSGVNLGLFCSTPGVALGRAVGRKAAQEMLLTGKFISAAEAQALGLINRAVTALELDAAVDQAADAIAAKAPDAIALGKAIFRRQIEQPLADAYVTASAAMVENLGFDSAKDGIDGFLARAR